MESIMVKNETKTTKAIETKPVAKKFEDKSIEEMEAELGFAR